MAVGSIQDRGTAPAPIPVETFRVTPMNCSKAKLKSRRTRTLSINDSKIPNPKSTLACAR